MMIKKHNLKTLATGGLLLLSAFSTVKAQKVTSTKPNIVIVYADDLAYGDVSNYGGKVKTPHIDQLAT